MSVSPQRCGSWGGGVRGRSPWELVSGNLTCPLSSLHPGSSWGFSLPGAIFEPTALCYPQTIIGHPGQQGTGSGSPQCPGHSLTYSHVGEQPQAGLGRGPRAGKGGSWDRAGQRQKPAGVNSSCRGGCPGRRGSPRLACPGNRQSGACSLPLVLLAACQLLSFTWGSESVA